MQHPEHDYMATPWFRWRDLPLILLFIPFGLFFGLHVAGLAMVIRRWLRIPYLLAMIGLYASLTIPLWTHNPTSSLLFPAIATSIVLFTTFVPIALGGRDEVMDGSSFEHSAPAHITLCLAYMALAAVGAALRSTAT